jgi:uncharacterized damage-inducible protein DinB
MLQQMFAYKGWSDHRIFDAIKTLDKVVSSDTFNFSLQQLNHLAIVEELFKARLLNNSLPHVNTNSEVVPSLDELLLRLEQSQQWYCAYIETLSQSELEQQLAFTFMDGKKGCMSISEILFHIVNHASYHRGSIAHALDLAGVAHPSDSYNIFIHNTEPERRNIK